MTTSPRKRSTSSVDSKVAPRQAPWSVTVWKSSSSRSSGMTRPLPQAPPSATVAAASSPPPTTMVVATARNASACMLPDAKAIAGLKRLGDLILLYYTKNCINVIKR